MFDDNYNTTVISNNDKLRTFTFWLRMNYVDINTIVELLQNEMFDGYICQLKRDLNMRYLYALVRTKQRTTASRIRRKLRIGCWPERSSYIGICYFLRYGVVLASGNFPLKNRFTVEFPPQDFDADEELYNDCGYLQNQILVDREFSMFRQSNVIIEDQSDAPLHGSDDDDSLHS